MHISHAAMFPVQFCFFLLCVCVWVVGGRVAFGLRVIYKPGPVS